VIDRGGPCWLLFSLSRDDFDSGLSLRTPFEGSRPQRLEWSYDEDTRTPAWDTGSRC